MRLPQNKQQLPSCLLQFLLLGGDGLLFVPALVFFSEPHGDVLLELYLGVAVDGVARLLLYEGRANRERVFDAGLFVFDG